MAAYMLGAKTSLHGRGRAALDNRQTSERATIIEKFMISIRPIAPESVIEFKTIRLCALQESPSAFGSTYARESELTDAEWLQRLQRWNGETGIGFLAVADGLPCGIAGSLVYSEDSSRAQLISMWTAPTHRRRGVGKLLVNAIVRWARERGCQGLYLMVTSGNDSAIAFYEHLGFSFTGHTMPYPNDAAVTEREMAMPLL